MITELERQLVNMYVINNLESYKNFMGINEIPEFDIVLFEISLEEAGQKGYGVLASHSYNVNTDKHTLKVWKDIYKSTLYADYILFHEFTHMYDTVNYSAKDKILYASNRGFTEYHAAQVELLKLLGGESIENIQSFSLTEQIETIAGQETVFSYITNSHAAVTEFISRSNFLDSIESLSTGFGLFFNHLGRMSICRMYASDYDQYIHEVEKINFEDPYIEDKFSEIKPMMKGFLSEADIMNIGRIYFSVIIEIAKKM